MIGKYIVGSLERKLPNDLLEKWRFPTEYRAGFRGEIFTGDGSRGGPERRELTDLEQSTFGLALKAAGARPSKL